MPLRTTHTRPSALAPNLALVLHTWYVSTYLPTWGGQGAFAAIVVPYLDADHDASMIDVIDMVHTRDEAISAIRRYRGEYRPGFLAVMGPNGIEATRP